MPAASFSHYEYLLAELRCALLRARLQVSDIEAIGLALKGGLIDADQAVAYLHVCGCDDFIQPEEPPL